jgi:hypothetical protein
MSGSLLERIRDLIQKDVGGRGLAHDPHDNLLLACRDDLAHACRSIATTPRPVLGVVTGFYIAHADPPGGETDGPLGALFLARALAPLGIAVTLVTDPFCRQALKAGLKACGLSRSVSVRTVQERARYSSVGEQTHLVALERVGPSHTLESVQAQPGMTPEAVQRFQSEVPPDQRDRCYSMRGRDITEFMRPVHRLFEGRRPCSIGIGDGGNEIGMGKISWDVIQRNIPRGGLIACRVPTDHLIVAGVSNWGAYALAAGVAVLRGQRLPAALFDSERERELLRVMVEEGPLVDGKSGRPTVAVDGLSFDEYAEPLRGIGELLGREQWLT